MNNPTINMSVQISYELNRIVEEIAEKTSSSKSEVFKKSLVLLKIVIDEVKNGNGLGIIGKDQEILKEIVGLL